MSVSIKDSVQILKVGVVGCGEIAQIVHLPNIMLAPHMFSLVALCDVSPELLGHCGEKFHVSEEQRYGDLETMLSNTPLDLILILSPSELHVPQALLCLKYKKHIFIEKPLANTLSEVDALEKARLESGKIVFVGYMRRYAGAVDLVKKRLEGKGIRYVRVRELIGSNEHFTTQSTTYPLYPTSPPPPSSPSISQIRKEAMVENFGESLGSNPETIPSWGILTNLGSHSISMMRELIGSPVSVGYANRSGGVGSRSGSKVDGGEKEGEGVGWWNVIFDYDGFKAHYEMGIDQVPLFDAHIEIYTDDERIRIQYDTPYIRGLPITITLQSRLPSGEYSSQTIRPTYEDPYTLEFRELYDCIVYGKEVRTSVEDARRDTELAIEIIKALK